MMKCSCLQQDGFGGLYDAPITVQKQLKLYRELLSLPKFVYHDTCFQLSLLLKKQQIVCPAFTSDLLKLWRKHGLKQRPKDIDKMAFATGVLTCCTKFS